MSRSMVREAFVIEQRRALSDDCGDKGVQYLEWSFYLTLCHVVHMMKSLLFVDKLDFHLSLSPTFVVICF